MRMLIAMQFYDADRSIAMEVCRLIADIEPEFRKDVDMVFVARRDCNHDEDTIEYCSKKFKCLKETSSRGEIGWPNGPNGIWHHLMTWVFEQTRRNFHQWDCVLTIESDCVPLASDWIHQLKNEWLTANKLAVGCFVGGGVLHVNGNAMFDVRLMEKIPTMYGTPHEKSWDTHHADKIMPHAYDTPLIVSEHGWKKPITEARLYQSKEGNIKPVLFHGCKHDGARKIVRNKLVKKEYA